MGGSGWAVKLWSVTQAELRENNLLVPQLWLLPTLPATRTSSRLLTAPLRSLPASQESRRLLLAEVAGD